MLTRTRLMIVGSTAALVTAMMFARRAAPPPGSVPPRPGQPAEAGGDLPMAANARAVLTAFLEASREQSPTAAAADTLRCQSSRADLPVSMLGAYTVLPPAAATGRPDTLLVRAAVTTVAEEDRSRERPNAYVARLRTRLDTMEWDAFRERETGRLVICNGLELGFLPDTSAIEWRSAGESYQRAKAIADSIYTASRRN